MDEKTIIENIMGSLDYIQEKIEDIEYEYENNRENTILEASIKLPYIVSEIELLLPKINNLSE